MLIQGSDEGEDIEVCAVLNVRVYTHMRSKYVQSILVSTLKCTPNQYFLSEILAISAG